MKDLINGPWTIDMSSVYFDIRDADGDAIADTCAASCQLETGKYKNDPRTLAVTNLISAAPELYEALRELIDHCDDANPWIDLSDAKDALAKARGEKL